MKEKRKKEKYQKKSKHKEKRERKPRSSSSSSSSSTVEWVEKKPAPKAVTSERDDWMSMTGMLRTYTKEDIKKPKQDEKKHIDSYDPATSSRELNPYWKSGGGGLPQTLETFRQSNPFLKPDDTEDLYKKTSCSKSYETYTNKEYLSCESDQKYRSTESNRQRCDSYNNDRRDESYSQRRSYNWRKEPQKSKAEKQLQKEDKDQIDHIYSNSVDLKTSVTHSPIDKIKEEKKDSQYLSDEKMNKLGARIVKAEIMGNTKLVEELKVKLEEAREYRRQKPNAGKEEDDGIMLMSTNNMGNSRPLTKHATGDPRSKGGKRKAETHSSGERNKYFGNDDKYNLHEMFQEEKYGNNYDEDAELARIAAKHKNPNDDLEDIFTDEISKTRNDAKDSEREKQRAINAHSKMEKSLEGCEHCVDSKNMLKHLMVSCGRKVYVALPARKSLVKGQCLITTIQHSTCVTAIDEDVWEEVMNYRKALTQFFNSQDKDVVFFETAMRMHRFPHMVIHCVPLPRDVGDMAAIYFKKAILECEAEWSMNKKVVDLKGKGIRKGIPKGLPYFWIDFGMDPGFAHVIEDQQLFPRNFAEEIIGGILDLDHNLWKNPQREYGDLQRKKVLEFVKKWKPFDIVKNKE